ncbi:EpsG family protein [Marinilongibacter aquaticus]|uniref:EpsG family protein n=1 Tax=Marinilongibacter aquaticus TaxID=2975157 RepID=UPI0021BD36F4|nr:EpsG family protein [Marinilongibacter aquaticus]UBM57641.1 EpsG family protein [Marinilongibacter aquaticus]
MGLTLLYDVLGLRGGRGVAYILLCFALILLAGLRYRVGGDTSNYMHTHEIFPKLTSILTYDYASQRSIEIGWVIFSSACKMLSDDFVVLQLIHALFVNVIIFKFIYRYTRHIFLAATLYFILLFPYLNFEILRQAVSITIFLGFGLKYLIEGKWFRYLLMSLLSLAFHYSALILFCFPFVMVLLKQRLIIIAMISSTVFASGIFLNNLLSNIVLFNPFEMAVLKKMQFYGEYNLSNLGLLLSFIQYIVVPIIIYAFLKRFNRLTDVNSLVIIYVFIAAVSSSFPILFRMIYFIFPLYIISLADSIFLLLIRIKSTFWFKMAFLNAILAVILLMHTYEWFKKIEGGYGARWYVRWYPYHSVFTREISPEREALLTF